MNELKEKVILEIKKIKITDNAKLADVEKELFSLSQTVKKYIPDESKISEYKDQLVKINTKLWNLENAKRAAEKTGEFGEKFINDARSVYKLNDETI